MDQAKIETNLDADDNANANTNLNAIIWEVSNIRPLGQINVHIILIFCLA